MSSKIGVLALTVVFALFPWVAGVYAGEKSEAESKTSSNEIKIGVGGMMCDGCVAKLEKALWSSMGDSVSVKVSLGSEMAQLTCPIGKFLEVEVLQKEVTNTGFTAEGCRNQGYRTSGYAERWKTCFPCNRKQGELSARSK